MARDFTKNTSNKISLGVGTLGPLWNGARQLAFHVWINFRTFSAGGFDNRLFGALFGANFTIFTGFIDGTAAQKRFGIGGRSQSTDTFQSRTHLYPIMAGNWYSLGGVVDFQAARVFPFVNGIRGPSLSASFGSTTLVDNATGRTNSDAIGCPDATSLTTQTQVDGRMADLTIWKDARLSELDFSRLAAGWPSYLIRPGKIINRWTLSDAGVIDIVNQKNGTISGTVGLVPYEPFCYSAIRPYVPFFDAQAAVTTNSNFFQFMSAG